MRACARGTPGSAFSDDRGQAGGSLWIVLSLTSASHWKGWKGVGRSALFCQLGWPLWSDRAKLGSLAGWHANVSIWTMGPDFSGGRGNGRLIRDGVRGAAPPRSLTSWGPGPRAGRRCGVALQGVPPHIMFHIIDGITLQFATPAIGWGSGKRGAQLRGRSRSREQ